VYTIKFKPRQPKVPIKGMNSHTMDIQLGFRAKYPASLVQQLME